MTKTNAMRLLDQKKIEYEVKEIEDAEGLSGSQMALKAGENPEEVYKTLVTVGAKGAHYVFVVPVEKELDLKKAAKTVGEKSISMIHQKELLPLTGYIHGGCSPVGMKKFFRTVFDKSALSHERIYFSGGKVGVQVRIRTVDISKAIKCEFEDIVS
ncbi:MAG: Cys-tRNA(Pro) deacylase [Solobacterium sp.]|nr:Cys-tRNA(Pro) deacylase [Erysipelotrichaceae bacterium]MCI6699950.1 Cys-tRNA(Pro) deacylase [Solobacterium sp.]MCI7732833.1 Cys-tRNA(Pro) deacylase [Solobacterium sp.]MDD6122177.1 Cys-tRNA(Pro) deacylase [Solobacterium sp.]MDD6835439.1 Cys-tRNA(Pro) deacylase [Solobacterium sp.]